MRDYTENEAINAAFAAQGYYLYNYLVLKIENISSGNAINVARNWRDDLNKLSCYSEVSLNSSTYDLTATPDTEYFNKQGDPYMQLIGSLIKDSNNQVTGYQLIIIAYVTED